MSEGYQLYSGKDDEPTRGSWHVLVEYSNRGQRGPHTLLTYPVRHLPSREEALAKAEETAHEYEPPDPWSPQRRQVFRDGDGFLTVIQGATQTFHFSTRAVEMIDGG